MRNLRKLSYFLLFLAIICLSRITHQQYCSLVYGVDALLFGGCDFAGTGLSAGTLMHRIIQLKPGKPSQHRNVQRRGHSNGPGKQSRPVEPSSVSTTNKNDAILEKLVRVGNDNIIFDKNILAKSKRTCVKRILFWADPTKEGLKAYLSNFKSKTALCRDLGCTAQLTISMEWSDFSTNDVVIFHHKVHKDWPELIKRRPSGQIWIFYTRESPAHTSERNNFPEGISYNVHNWTKVYLSGSDLMTIYGRFIPKEMKKNVKETPNWFQNKTKLCAWVASNCKYTSWDRLEFVKALEKHMPIDMYGRCGDLDCPDDCRGTMVQYKFYLALESHTCREYITEKVWRNAFEQNVIPVVYGAPKSDYENLLPPKSFIHVEDFESFEELATYLFRVAEDEEEYNSYFAWKTKGVIKRETGSSIFTNPSLCEIAEKVIAVHNGEYVSSWDDMNIKDWWQGSCFIVKNKMIYR